MVVTGPPAALAPTLVVPDEQTWTVSGADPVAAGLRPVFALAEVQRLLLPERLPDALTDALAACLAQLPRSVAIDRRALPDYAGRPSASALEPDVAHYATDGGEDEAHEDKHAGHGGHDMGGAHADDAAHDMHAGHGGHDVHAGHGGHDMHAGHGGHDMHGAHGGHHMHGDHGDMMAIVGDPSADGLVMEPMELRFGPLGTPLPGGLVVDITLDGDVVAESAVHALLIVEDRDGRTASVPDLLAPVAWRAAIAAARDVPKADTTRWLWIAAIEIERAVSHLAWLRALGRLLGWGPLVRRSSSALSDLVVMQLRPHSEDQDPDAEEIRLDIVATARHSVEAVVALVRRSRWLRLRTAGRGALTPEQARDGGLHGPLARASGLPDDARTEDPLYRQLGFEPLVRSDGDALARTLLRAEEARAALDLASAALQVAADGTPAEDPLRSFEGASIEGPRGPISASRHPDGWRLEASGAEEAPQAAGAAMVGAEWAAALVTLISFDLSPWRVHT